MGEEDLQQLAQREPGNPLFADLMALLIAREAFSEAIMVGVKGLSINPDCHKGRLFLAHAFFRSDCVPFAAREVAALVKEFPDKLQLRVLLEKLQPGAINQLEALDAKSTQNESREVADVEFDPDLLDDL